MSMSETMARLFGRATTGPVKSTLSRRAVEQDSIDHMEFGNYADDSPRFRRIAVEDAPTIAPDLEDPPPIDFTTATPEEIKAWQKQAREVKARRENADPYSNWPDLTEDAFTAYHHYQEPKLADAPVDPGVDIHRRIMGKVITDDDFAASRNVTRNDPTMSAMATMALARRLSEIAGEELLDQMREAQEFERLRKEGQDAIDEVESLRGQVEDYVDSGQPVPDDLRGQLKGCLAARRQAVAKAIEAADSQTPMTQAAVDAIAGACKEAAQAAENAKNLPSFGSGFGQGEPVYESPEQALSIAEMWATNEELKRIAAMYGRLDNDIRFHRAKRVEGGQDEIVDVQFGDNLARVLPAELALLGDEDFEDDFLIRYSSRELLEFSTVGEELAGRGPILMVCDGSGSMSGARNVWARAIMLSLLHIARREKRDFGAVEFSGGSQTEEWLFPANQALDAQRIVDMASHFFGGGTTPITGVTRAWEIMRAAPAFKKADLVLLGDGEASFGPEDKRIRDQLTEMGVRIFGLAVGSDNMRYLTEYCEFVAHVHDFELDDPSAATAELATHIN